MIKESSNPVKKPYLPGTPRDVSVAATRDPTHIRIHFTQ